LPERARLTGRLMIGPVLAAPAADLAASGGIAATPSARLYSGKRGANRAWRLFVLFADTESSEDAPQHIIG
jgi:hypothetical protein